MVDFDNVWRRAATGVMHVPTTPIDLYGLAHNLSTRLGGPALPYGAEAQSASQRLDEGIRGITGSPIPTETSDIALESLGNVLVAPPRALVAAAPLVGRALQAMFITPRSIPGRAIDAGLQTGVGSAILNATDAPAAAQPNDVSSLFNDPAARSAPTQSASVPAPTVPQVQAPTQLASASPEISSLFGDAAVPAPAPIVPEHPQRDAPMSWNDAFVAAGVAALAVGGGQAAVRLMRTAPIRGAADLTGTMPASLGVTTRGERIATNVQDETAALTSVLDRSVGGPVAADFRNRAGLDFNSHAVAQRARHFWETGDAEGYTRSLASPRALTESIAELGPRQQEFKDYIAARNEQNNRVFGLPSRPDIADADITARIAAGDTDPVFTRLRGEYQNITQTMLHYANARGLIDNNTLTTMLRDRPDFMPQAVFTEKPSLWRRIADIAPPQEQAVLQNFREYFDLPRQQPGVRFAPPIEALEQFSALMFRVANTNAARTTWLDAMKGASVQGVRDTVRELAQAPKHEPDNLIRVWDAGRERHFVVNDPVLLTSLRHMPQTLSVLENAANVARRGLQFGATGGGNPTFSITAGLYDAIAATITHPKGTRFGMFPGDVVGAIAGSASGTARGLYGQATRAISHMLEDSWRNNGVLSQAVGVPATRALAERMAATWSRTTLHSMEETGALSSGRYVHDPNIQNVYSMLDVTNPNYASQAPMLRRAWDTYRGVLDMISSGARIHFYATNFGRFDERTLARMTRQLVGDPSQHGAGRATAALTHTLPYSNVFLQETAALSKTFRSNPGLASSRLAVAMGIPAMFAVWNAARLGPNYLDHMFRRMTGQQQSTYIPLYMDGEPPENAAFVAVPNSLRPVYSMIRDGYAMLTNATGGEANSTRMWDNFMAGVWSSIPTDPPPALRAMANLAGADIQGGYQQGGAWNFSQLQGAGRIVGEPQYNRALPPDASLFTRAVEHNLTGALASSLFGTAGQMLVESARATEQAMRGGAPPRQALDEGLTTIRASQERSLPMLNSIWTAGQRVVTQNLDARMLSQKEAALQRAVSQYTTNVQTQGAVGTRAHPIGMEGMEQVDGIHDLSMVPVLSEVHRFATTVLPAYNHNVQALRQQMDALQSDPTMGPRQREQARNAAGRDLMNEQRRVLERIVEFEDYLSSRYDRRIRVEDLTRRSRLNDFAPLRAPSPSPA